MSRGEVAALALNAMGVPLAVGGEQLTPDQAAAKERLEKSQSFKNAPPKVQQADPRQVPAEACPLRALRASSSRRPPSTSRWTTASR